MHENDFEMNPMRRGAAKSVSNVRSNNENLKEAVGPTKIWKILLQLDKNYFERKLY
jgi:hypothetical protein